MCLRLGNTCNSELIARSNPIDWNSFSICSQEFNVASVFVLQRESYLMFRHVLSERCSTVRLRESKHLSGAVTQILLRLNSSPILIT